MTYDFKNSQHYFVNIPLAKSQIQTSVFVFCSAHVSRLTSEAGYPKNMRLSDIATRGVEFVPRYCLDKRLAIRLLEQSASRVVVRIGL